MRKLRSVVSLGMMVMLGVASGQAQTLQNPYAAGGVATNSSVSRISYLEDKVANLETTLQSCQKGGSCCETSCGSGCGISRACCHTAGLVGGYDFLFLSPSFSNGVSYQVLENVAPVSIWTQHGYPTDYKMAPRFWLGYQGNSGLGARIRYMQFDHELMSQSITTDATTTVFFDGLSANDGETLSFATGMELHVLDIDITQAFNVCGANVTAGAGLRYAKLLFDYSAAITDTGSPQVSVGESTFEGVGPSAFIDFTAPIRQSSLSVVGGLRGSVLFGRGRDVETVVGTDPISLTASTEHANRSTGVLESSLGLQYDRSLTRGTDLFIRGAWEGQLWMDVGSPTYSGGDMALQGLSLSLGISR